MLDFNGIISLDKKDTAVFLDCVGDLLELEDVKRLVEFPQHLNTNRLDHSINVALCCFAACKRFGLDYRSAARAGLLHDLFHYDTGRGDRPEENHISGHPRIALKTARKNVKLNKIEEDSILRHMWPLTLVPPKYREGYVLTLADKYCCTMEVSKSFLNWIHSYVLLYKNMYAGGSYAK